MAKEQMMNLVGTREKATAKQSRMRVVSITKLPVQLKNRMTPS
jgi:hypothetical protein